MELEAFPMKSGNGPESYARNSSFQRGGVTTSMALISEFIANDTESKEQLSSWSPFRIADLGCSTGPNTFMAVQGLMESMDLKYKAHGLHAPEFQVFFNDHASNDFNTLFVSLPSDRRYFLAGVPGSFHGRLFPRASLHFVHSSYTLHWLSQVPKEVRDKNSPAWNEGRIYMNGAPDQVVRAYVDQHAEDMNKFLSVRAEEMVAGGYLALVLLCRGPGTAPEDSSIGSVLSLMGSTLLDMVAMGIIDEAKVDSFNVPIYTPSVEEVERLVEENGCFSLECVHPLFLPSNRGLSPDEWNGLLRAVVGGVLCNHFGADIVDQLFELNLKKFEVKSHLLSNVQGDEIFVLLKRNCN